MENIKCLLTNFPWDLLGFLLGLGALLWWLLSKFIGDRLRAHNAELQDRINYLEGELEACRKSKIDSVSKGLGISETTKVTSSKPKTVETTKTKVEDTSSKKDDLKIVEGIGPKIEELCNNAGIFTFAQLAETQSKALKEILDAAGARFQMHDPQTWPKQAELARDGKFGELKAWQDELNKGKA